MHVNAINGIFYKNDHHPIIIIKITLAFIKHGAPLKPILHHTAAETQF